MTNIGVLSDTHGIFDNKIIEFMMPCDELWHAGDIGSFKLLEQIENFKPLKAVYGNIDNYKVRLAIPEIQKFKVENKNIMITHIGGYPGKYSSSIAKLLENNAPDILVCGHSHILKVQYDKKYNLLHINPGAAGKSGLHKFRTAVRFSIDKSDIKDFEILEIPR